MMHAPAPSTRRAKASATMRGRKMTPGRSSTRRSRSNRGGQRSIGTLSCCATPSSSSSSTSSSSAAAAAAAASSSSEGMRVVVAGGTGYIGKFVVRELASRGHEVAVLTRERSGIGGSMSVSDVERELGSEMPVDGPKVVLADVVSSTVEELVARIADGGGGASAGAAFAPDVAVCCLASRTGGVKDSWLIDYEATKKFMQASIRAGVRHFVLLSAICVQRPTLEFQRAKLQLEAELISEAAKSAASASDSGSPFSYSIVRPTAFFKSLAGQVEVVKGGGPYVMFGDGKLASCKPISEADLARYMADCVTDTSLHNKVLPVGGPGAALSAKQQGEILFQLLGKKPFFFPVPVALFDGINALLRFVHEKAPQLVDEDVVEFGNIGKYYAVESMLVWDGENQRYDADLTPSYGSDTLEEFFRRALFEDGMKGQDLGDQAVFK